MNVATVSMDRPTTNVPYAGIFHQSFVSVVVLCAFSGFPPLINLNLFLGEGFGNAGGKHQLGFFSKSCTALKAALYPGLLNMSASLLSTEASISGENVPFGFVGISPIFFMFSSVLDIGLYSEDSGLGKFGLPAGLPFPSL